MKKKAMNTLERLGILKSAEPPPSQRTYVVVLAINPDVTAFSVTGHIVDGVEGGNCIPLEGRAGWAHLLTIVEQLRKLDDAKEVTISDAILKGQPRFRGQMPKEAQN